MCLHNEDVDELINLTQPDIKLFNDIIVYNLTKRLELASSLVLDRPYASEPYQVVNYGMGGQYVVHPDMSGYHNYPGDTSYTKRSKNLWNSLVGDRQSTFLIYLSTVPSGGSTVFPLLGLKVSPTVGDAVLWNNINNDGTPDYLSLHGGCPTVLGSKWISNKWIMYYDNFRTCPCGLTEFQPIKPFKMLTDT